MENNKTLISVNIWEMIIIYIVVIFLGFYTNIIIGSIISIFSILSIIYIKFAINKLKKFKDEKLS